MEYGLPDKPNGLDGKILILWRRSLVGEHEWHIDRIYTDAYKDMTSLMQRCSALRKRGYWIKTNICTVETEFIQKNDGEVVMDAFNLHRKDSVCPSHGPTRCQVNEKAKQYFYGICDGCATEGL